MNSRYLINIAVIVIAYNVVINLVEVVWKHEVKELYPNPRDYTLYMNHVTTIIGVIATLTALFVSGQLHSQVWLDIYRAAYAFHFIYYQHWVFWFFFLKGNMEGVVYSQLELPPLPCRFFGSAQNCLSRAAKYSLFDATRELAFVPLSPDCKLKGKAAIDGVCNRLGKSGDP